MTYIVMAYIAVAYVAMAYIVMTYIVIAYIVMACTGMTSIVMALYSDANYPSLLTRGDGHVCRHRSGP